MADKPNVNPTPRQEFQSNTSWVTMHREIMQQPMLSVSIQFALSQYVRKFADASVMDGGTSAQSFFKIQGAHEFIDILRNLAEMPADIPKTKPKDQIDHKI